VGRTIYALALCLAVIPAACMALPDQSPDSQSTQAEDAKGIWLEGLKVHRGQSKKPPEAVKRGIQFHVLLLDEGRSKEVPSEYSFHDGDRMRFQFELNQDSYVYVLNRTISGGLDAGAKGIEAAPGSSEKPRVSPYRLLFPTNVAGQNNHLKAGNQSSIPAGDVAFRMDQEPGTEQLFVLISPTPLDIAKYFDKAGSPSDSPAGSKGIGETSSTQEELGRELAAMEENAEVSYAKGIGIDSYGLSRDSKKSAVIKVNLKHLPAVNPER
jgi:hypothetical protein